MKTVESLLDQVKASILHDVAQLEMILESSDLATREVVEHGYQVLREQGLEEALACLSAGMSGLMLESRAALLTPLGNEEDTLLLN